MKTTERLPPLLLLAALALLPACGPPRAASEAPPVPSPSSIGSDSRHAHAASPKPGPKPWDPFDSQLGKPPRSLPTLRYYTLPG